MSQWISYSSGKGNGALIVPSASLLPATATRGMLAVTQDTNLLYEFNGSSWIVIGSSAVGSLSGMNTGDVTLGTANGLSLLGQQLSLQLATTSLTGALSSTDWNIFNNKQAALGYTPVNKAGDTMNAALASPFFDLTAGGSIRGINTPSGLLDEILTYPSADNVILLGGGVNSNGVGILNDKAYKAQNTVGGYFNIASVDTTNSVVLSSPNAASVKFMVSGTSAQPAMEIIAGGDLKLYHALKIGPAGSNGTIFGGDLDLVSSQADGGDGTAGIGIASYRDSDQWGSFVYGTRYRGSLAVPTAVHTGDVLMEFGALGWDGANAVGGGEVMWTVDGTVSAGIIPSKAEISVTNSAGATITALTLATTGAATFLNTVNATTFVGALTGAASLNILTTAKGQANGVASLDINALLPIAQGGTGSGTALNNNRVMQSSGGAIVEASAITASRALVSDANGIPAASSVSTTTLSYLDATSSVQGQLNTKAADSAVIKKDGSVIFTGAQSMGGYKLTSVAAGTNANDAVTKSQLDSVAGGFVPQPDLADNNVIDDSLSSPPGSPTLNQTYLVAASATGAWAGKEGHLMSYTGAGWTDVLARAVIVGDWFGVTFEYGSGSEGGSFTGKHNRMMQVTGATPGSYTYSSTSPSDVTPSAGWLTIVTGANSLEKSHSYAYNNTLLQWVEVAEPQNLNPGNALAATGNVWNVQVDGSTIGISSNQLAVLSAPTATNFSGSLSGDVTGTQGATAIAAATVTGKILTGFVSGAGTVTATDTILQAFNKIDGNAGGKANTALSNLTTTSINQNLIPNADNTQDLGSPTYGWSTFYGDSIVSLADGLAAINIYDRQLTGTLGVSLDWSGGGAPDFPSGLTSGSTILPSTSKTLNIGGASAIWGGIHTVNNLLYGSTSGAITLKTPAAVTSHTLTLPSAQGAASQVLSNDGAGNLSWVTPASTPPGGATTQIQYNNAGAFAGSSLHTFNSSTGEVSITGAGSTTSMFIGTTAAAAAPSSAAQAGGEHLCIGPNTGLNLIASAARNLFIGNNAGNTTTSGSNNLFIGPSAGAKSLSSNNNIGIGYSSCGGISTTYPGSQNVCVGPLSGRYLQTAASNNNFVGYGAGQTATTGGDNVALGTSALSALTTGAENVAVGRLAGGAVTTSNSGGGFGSVFIGWYSGAAVTTNASNVCVGAASGRYQTGTANVFLGTQAGKGTSGSSTGNFNTAVGDAAGFKLTTGASNAALGEQALVSATTARYVTAVGARAAYAATTMNASTTTGTVAVGYQSLNAEQTGAGNTAVGFRAGYAQNGAADNTSIGASAGATVTTGNQNVFIGSGADSTLISNVGAVAIGYNAKADGSGAIAIGSGVTAATANTARIGTSAYTVEIPGTLSLLGTTSGAVKFAAPATAGSAVYTLPGVDGSSGQALTTNGSGTLSWATPAAPTRTVYASGSGTYTTPANCKQLWIRMVGGGGGGGGGGLSGGNGGDGGNTTFGTSLLAANGGAGGVDNSTNGGAGGTASLGTGPVGLALAGGMGFSDAVSAAYASGGGGGSSAFGGAGSNGGSTNAGAGAAGATNTGGGGGGGAALTSNVFGGCGGGAGGFVDATITTPSASYSYAVGAAGSAGSAGTNGYAGGAGGSGVIIIEERY